MKKEAIRGRVVRHRGSDKLILSKRFIAFLQEIRKEACAAKKKPAKPTLEKGIASLQNSCLLASFVRKKNLVQTHDDDGLFMYAKKNGGRIKMKATELFRKRGELPIATSTQEDLEATIKGLKLLASHSPIGPQGIHFSGS